MIRGKRGVGMCRKGGRHGPDGGPEGGRQRKPRDVPRKVGFHSRVRSVVVADGRTVWVCAAQVRGKRVRGFSTGRRTGRDDVGQKRFRY